MVQRNRQALVGVGAEIENVGGQHHALGEIRRKRKTSTAIRITAVLPRRLATTWGARIQSSVALRPHHLQGRVVSVTLEVFFDNDSRFLRGNEPAGRKHKEPHCEDLAPRSTTLGIDSLCDAPISRSTLPMTQGQTRRLCSERLCASGSFGKSELTRSCLER